MDQFNKFAELVLKEEPTAEDLGYILLVLGIFWGALFAVTIPILSKHFKKQEWFRDVSDSDFERCGKEILTLLGVKEETKDRYYDRFAFDYPWWWCVCFQHFCSGMLCLPAILGIGDESTAASLACLGVLSEVAWEISDTIMQLHKRYCTPHGKTMVPVGLLVVMLFHHSLSSFLGISMILEYRQLPALHWLCFELQAAAAVAVCSQQITKLLDVSDYRQHRLFLQLTGFTLGTLIVTRLIHWPILAAQVIMAWYQDAAWTYMAVGLPIIALFSVFNWVFAIQPVLKRMKKFWNMPVSKPAGKRRSLTAAASMVVTETAKKRRSINATFKRMDTVLKTD